LLYRCIDHSFLSCSSVAAPLCVLSGMHRHFH
jgi:hypothetical protein